MAETKIKRRYAREIDLYGQKILVIDINHDEAEKIKTGNLKIEKIKHTPKFDVYRRVE